MDTITSAPGKALNSDPETVPKIAQNGNLPPRRVKNIERRPREYLTEQEVERLIKAAESRGRYGHRDATMILMAYRHGLRVSELVKLRWSQIDLEMESMHVHRLKRGKPGMQPLGRREIQALNGLTKSESPFVFVSLRGGPVTAAGFRKTLTRIGEAAGFTFPVHPHMLRHACGFKLANDGRDTRAIQSYLGHRNIVHTVTYTELAAGRFRGFWED